MIKVPIDSTLEVIINAWISNMVEVTNMPFVSTIEKRGRQKYWLVSMMIDDNKFPLWFVDCGGFLWKAKPRNSDPGAYIDRTFFDGSIKQHPQAPF